MKKDKRKKINADIAADIYEQKLRREIQRIKALNRKYKSFHDMEIGGKDWEDYAKIMGAEKQSEMLKWAKGGVLCLAPLSRMEKVFWHTYAQIEVREKCEWDWSWESFSAMVTTMDTRHFSFIYAPNIPRSVIIALNWLLSESGLHIRFRAQLLNENGKPLGM